MKKRLRKAKVRTKKGGVLLILILFIILVLSYLFFFSFLFKIKSVEVSGNREVATEDIKEIFNYKNIFLFTKERIKNDLLNKFSKISELDIEKSLLKRTIKIEIKERERLGIVCGIEMQESGEKIKNCFYIDKKGVIFESYRYNIGKSPC